VILAVSRTNRASTGKELNTFTKFVALSKREDPLERLFAATSMRVSVATIGKLKDQSGNDIWPRGSLKLMQSLTGAGVVVEVRMLGCLAALIPPTRRGGCGGSGSDFPRGLLVHALPASGQTRDTFRRCAITGRGQAVWKPGPKPTNAKGHRTMTPGRFCSHSRREIAYSTPPCSSPGIDTGPSAV
jgi:hypothetical protein